MADSSRAAKALARAREIDETYKGSPDLTTVIELLEASEKRMAVELARLRAEHTAELAAQEARLMALKGGDPSVAPSRPSSSASKASAKKAEEPQQQQHQHHHFEAGDALTYDEAFAAVGGQQAVSACIGESERVLRATSDDALDAELALLLPRDFASRTGFSTRLVNQPYVTDFDELYDQALAVHGSFGDFVRGLAVTCGPGCVAIVPPPKGKQRARMKAAFKYRDTFGDGIAYYRLTDLVRGTLIFDSVEAMYRGLVKIVFEVLGEKQVREFNDRYQTPLAGGYRDLQLVLEHEGHLSELQLNTTPMLRAKETKGHRDFEIVRELRSAVFDGDLPRVVTALAWGKINQGAVEDGTLGRVLRSDAAKTLLHDAAERGRADIVRVFLDAGCDVDARDARGNTALHRAALQGYERTVWALLDLGEPDLDAENADGETALVNGYVMLHKRPPEAAIRSVSTLSQVCGPDRIRKARAAFPAALKRRLQNSRLLVDLALDGNSRAVREELCKYADPDSTRDALSALDAAVTNGHTETVMVLLDFHANPTTALLLKAINSALFNVAKELVQSGARLDHEDFKRLIQVAVDRRWAKGLDLFVFYATRIDAACVAYVDPVFVAAVKRGDRDDIAQIIFTEAAATFSSTGLPAVRAHGETFDDVVIKFRGTAAAPNDNMAGDIKQAEKDAAAEKMKKKRRPTMTTTTTTTTTNDDNADHTAKPAKRTPATEMDEDGALTGIVLEISAYKSRIGIAGESEPHTATMVPAGLIVQGVLEDFALLEKFFLDQFVALGISAKDHPLLLSEPALMPKASRERCTRLAFEALGCSAFFMSSAGALAMYASGRTTGLVVDMGHSHSTIAPYYEGYGLPHAIQKTVGGQQVTAYLAELLAHENDDPVLRKQLPDLAIRIKEAPGTCYVASNHDGDAEKRLAAAPATFTTTDGTQIALGTAPSRCAEALFNPVLVKSETDGVAQLCFSSIMKCDVDIRKDMYKNIIAAGGGSLFPHFETRLLTDVTALAPSSTEIRVVAPPERECSAWIGGSILASLSTFQQMWVSKEEYDESGPQIVHRKCL